MSQNLTNLLKPWLALPYENIPIKSLCLDSRKIDKHSLFLAIKGIKLDGRKYISSAISKGAAAVLKDADNEEEHGQVVTSGGVNIISFWKLAENLSEIAQRFYHYPTINMKIIGVTGTNGKTTVTHIIAQWLELLESKCGVMGTTGNGLLSDLKPTLNTTGSPIDIISEIKKFSDANIENLVMEVSSHGLVQNRVKALDFEVGVFTNLTRDHLDYHGSMENYALAKKALFTQHKTKYKIINYDDKLGRKWLQEFSDALIVATTPIDTADLTQQYVYATDVKYNTSGLKIKFESSWGGGEINPKFIGQFNACNVLLALATLLTLGYPLEQLVAVSSNLHAVIGRMEVFTNDDLPIVIVDYAHTPDALEKAIQAIRLHCDKNLWCVCGCGGDRDKGKRPLMAKVACTHADRVIFTSDNPRSEDPQAIIDDMVGELNNTNYTVVLDRKSASELAMSLADKKDIILIAGKGHENYQVIGDKRISYSDRVVVENYLGLKHD